MKRQEVLLNLALVACIGGLAYLIFQTEEEAPVVVPEIELAEGGVRAPGGNETFQETRAYPYQSFGRKPIFQPLLTPTPTPTPSPTPPPKTPDIMQVLAHIRVTGILDGMVSFEDTKASQQGLENAWFDKNVGESFPVTEPTGQTRMATVKAVDESDLGNPWTVIGLEGTTYEKLYEPFKDNGVGSLKMNPGEGGAAPALVPIDGQVPAPAPAAAVPAPAAGLPAPPAAPPATPATAATAAAAAGTPSPGAPAAAAPASFSPATPPTTTTSGRPLPFQLPPPPQIPLPAGAGRRTPRANR